MKYPLVIYLLVAGLMQIVAQPADSLDSDAFAPYSLSPGTAAERPLTPKKTKFDLSVGTSFGIAPGSYYAPSLFVAPGISHWVSPRFRVSGGLYLEQTRVYPISQGSEEAFLPMTRAFLYARGDYQLAPRLLMSGTVLTSLPVQNAHSREQDFATRNLEAMELGLEYKITPSLSIGVQMRMQNRPTGFYDPMMPYSHGAYSPFYW